MADDKSSVRQAQFGTRGLAIVFTFACSALPGCDNAGERISLSPWKQVGTRAAPVSDLRGDVVSAQVAPGDGRAVEPGDLVKIQLTTSRTCKGVENGQSNFVGQTEPHTAWLWTGREPDLSMPHTNKWQEQNRWGGLGSERFRAVLIGKRVGEKFRVRLADGAEGFESIPLNGFSVIQDFATTLFQIRDELPRWPDYQIASRELWANVEILSACGGALHRREATLEQRGAVSSMFGQNYASRRADTIRWSALEGRCGSPDGKVWLQIGPLYYVHIKDKRPTNLYDWASSYKRLRPAIEFPEEYNVKESKGSGRHCDRPQAPNR